MCVFERVKHIRTWFAKALSPGHGPRRSPGPGGTYSCPLPALTLMYCVFASKIGTGSNRAVAALALPCLFSSALTASSARLSRFGSWLAASRMAVGQALVNWGVAAPATSNANRSEGKYMVAKSTRQR